MTAHKRRPYKPSRQMRRFINFLANIAPRYRWQVVGGTAIRGYSQELRRGRCVEPGDKCYCPLTACYPAGHMSQANDYASTFGLTRREGRLIMLAADNPPFKHGFYPQTEAAIAVLRPLLFKAVGLPAETE